MITKQQYQEAITNLNLAMKQLEPDGKCCSICGDNDHQAWECHHNPLSLSSRLGENEFWRCFHCNSVFTNFKDAEHHFGKREEHSRPRCERLCSGYGVFPDGSSCDGCNDCR